MIKIDCSFVKKINIKIDLIKIKGFLYQKKKFKGFFIRK